MIKIRKTIPNITYLDIHKYENELFNEDPDDRYGICYFCGNLWFVCTRYIQPLNQKFWKDRKIVPLGENALNIIMYDTEISFRPLDWGLGDEPLSIIFDRNTKTHKIITATDSATHPIIRRT